MSINLETYKNIDGILVPIEFDSFAFTPKRIFYVYGVPAGEERGLHAHYETLLYHQYTLSFSPFKIYVTNFTPNVSP